MNKLISPAKLYLEFVLMLAKNSKIESDLQVKKLTYVKSDQH